MRRTMLCLTLSTAPLLMFSMAMAENHDVFIAGADPSARPENAPVEPPLRKDADWYAQALHDVSRPYPHSLRFLEDQGRWFTPFNKPGMTGPYDIRGWH